MTAAQDRLVSALEELLDDDGSWNVVPSPGCVTVTRGWPDGSVDTLIFLGPETAHARRDDADGSQVWAAGDTIDQVLVAVRELPAPLALDAPSSARARDRSTLHRVLDGL